MGFPAGHAPLKTDFEVMNTEVRSSGNNVDEVEDLIAECCVVC